MAHSSLVLCTIGYSGHTPQSFVETLQQEGITALLDIRLTPLSRKPGFSKTALGMLMAEAGIGYFHLRELGSPAPLRHQLAIDKNHAAFLAHYADYLAGQVGALDTATSVIAKYQACLMCVEAQPGECHRSVVAAALQRSMPSLKIVHLTPPLPLVQRE